MADDVAVAELIARLEEADAGNGNLSWVIAEHLGWAKFWCGLTVFVGPGEWADKVRRDPNSVSVTDLPGDIQAGQDSPPYTTSVDAALTLVTPAWRVYALQEQYVDSPGTWFAGLDHRTQPYLRGSKMGKGATAALALCIAALKARQAAPQPSCPAALPPNPNTDAAQET